MRRLVVLGAGTAGTMVVNRLRPRLPHHAWHITVVEQSDTHYYQPGYLFLPFGTMRPRDVRKPVRATLRHDVDLVTGTIDRVDRDGRTVHLQDGRELPYDYLVIATGTSPRPAETPGLEEALAGGDVHEFFTYAGAMRLAARLADWPGGRFVVHVAEMPIKCPVAPLEMAFLADSFFRERGIRDAVDLTYATPLPGAFTKPVSAELLGSMLTERRIALEPDVVVESIDGDAHVLRSFDGREIPFDLLVTIPVNMGADFVARSGLGDELSYVRVDKQTLLSVDDDRIFAVGDAADTPASKAGSVAHFQVDGFTENFLAHVDGRPMTDLFDGHANCFIESGGGKALLIDFNYETEPLPGTYPLPRVGPMQLLRESRINHLGKLAFRHLYWHVLLPGRRMPVPAHMSMAGKRLPATDGDGGAAVDRPDAPTPVSIVPSFGED
ncbi:NAD(P)/FAD-dependent oxidoreductase [Actinotalea sp. Marseille-Q4924]|uniref:type III sulfide quinone reductase, selenoprotein subtype n=1 Tax=Actinotalea sp. Marseille-Q4924 TaxID=2866571 RepID=UPI001CE3D297|nr:FAD/NAD(P)-binding oxidoreductase [Actinotalea sp. Marseille-Q4924]